MEIYSDEQWLLLEPRIQLLIDNNSQPLCELSAQQSVQLSEQQLAIDRLMKDVKKISDFCFYSKQYKKQNFFNAV